MKALWVASALSLALGATLGGALGALHMKWTMHEANAEARREARLCCESAYVTMKYYTVPRTDCGAKP